MRVSKQITSTIKNRSRSSQLVIDVSDMERLRDKVAELEEKLAEYENDETARRRADALLAVVPLLKKLPKPPLGETRGMQRVPDGVLNRIHDVLAAFPECLRDKT